MSAESPYAVLRHADYRRFLGGNLLALFGSQMQTVAVGWELYERTGKSLDLGLVGLAQGENPRLLQEKLESFLPHAERSKEAKK